MQRRHKDLSCLGSVATISWSANSDSVSLMPALASGKQPALRQRPLVGRRSALEPSSRTGRTFGQLTKRRLDPVALGRQRNPYLLASPSGSTLLESIPSPQPRRSLARMTLQSSWLNGPPVPGARFIERSGFVQFRRISRTRRCLAALPVQLAAAPPHIGNFNGCPTFVDAQSTRS